MAGHNAAMPIADADLQAAFTYAFPTYEMARTRHLSVDMRLNPQRADVNTLGHRRTLADHRARQVTTPNNDTLYSSAWLDLSAGALELVLPPFNGRYWSAQFLDASTRTAALLGSGSGHAGGQKLWLMHESDGRAVPDGVLAVRLPTRDVWLLVRVLVDGPQDLTAVHRLQDAMQLRPLDTAPVPAGPRAPKVAMGSPRDGADVLAVANDMLARNGVPVVEQSQLQAWQATGLGVAKPSEEQRAAWSDALPQLLDRLRQAMVQRGQAGAQGWTFPDPAIGRYGGNHLLRATVALGGLGALPPEEALYLSATVDSSGAPLQGDRCYRVTFPPQGLPNQAFWSLSMYQVESDGRLFFVDNPLRRYAVGDRTPGLPRGADGALQLQLRAAAPADTAGWLPAPEGPFRLMLRVYRPAAALLEQRAPLPQVQQAPC